MARRKHYWGRTPLPHDGGPKLWRMVLFLFILAMMYTQMRQASNWAWLARTAQAQETTSPPATTPAGDAPASENLPAAAPLTEMLRPGPTDKDEWDNKAVKDSLAVVTDKTAIQESEMPAYWNLMRWTLAQSPKELQQRASQETSMKDLWSSPADYRGKLVRIPLHIRLIEKFEAKGENSVGLKTGYELWGWSDKSMSLPFSVVVPELPPGLEVGDDIAADGVFVGYFLKWMWYQPRVGKARSSPLLIGRVISQPKKVMKTASLSDDPLFAWAAGGVAIVVFGLFLWARLSPRRIRPIVSIPKDEEAALNFLQGALADSPAPAVSPSSAPVPAQEPVEVAAAPKG